MSKEHLWPKWGDPYLPSVSVREESSLKFEPGMKDMARARLRRRPGSTKGKRLRLVCRLAGNWTFVVITDRVELDDQIAKTFKTVGPVSQAEGDQCHAASGARLRELLRGNHRYVFTLIHKFQTPEALTDRADAINALIALESLRRDFFGHEQLVGTTMGWSRWYSARSYLRARSGSFRSSLS